MREMPMDSEVTECWFCGQPVLTGERANRSLHGRIAVHTDCLRHDALNDSDRGGSSDRAVQEV
jgi:hypothetical protein